MKCEYCGEDAKSEEKKCGKCGAKLPEPSTLFKSDPFFYQGYIVYTLRDFAYDRCEVQFWLGRELVERIPLSMKMLYKEVPEYCDAMPFVWELFKVAHGEKEVGEWQVKNDKQPAVLEIRRIVHVPETGG